MRPFRFPFQWGSTPTVTPPPPVIPPLWNKVTATGHWGHGAAPDRTPRFEHIYAQVPSAQPYRSQNLIYTVQTQYPFLIGPNTTAVIASTLSEP